MKKYYEERVLPDYLKSLMKFSEKRGLGDFSKEDVETMEEEEIFFKISEIQKRIGKEGLADFWKFSEFLKDRAWVLV